MRKKGGAYNDTLRGFFTKCLRKSWSIDLCVFTLASESLERPELV